MTRRQANTAILAGAAVLVAAPASATQETEPIALPPPRGTGGKPLIEALMLRRSTREYSERPLSLQVLSDLLWAAFGVNRPSGDRTAPYWRHIMVIDVYAVMANGVWLYEPKRHALLPQLSGDVRAQTGLQDFVGIAPLNLVYVAHGERMQDISPQERTPLCFGQIPALSGRMSICSARRKDSERSSEVPSITTSSVEPCNLVPTNSSPSRKPSVICGISAGWTTGMLEQLLVRDGAEWLVLSISSSPSQPSVLQRA